MWQPLQKDLKVSTGGIIRINDRCLPDIANKTLSPRKPWTTEKLSKQKINIVWKSSSNFVSNIK